MKEYFGKSSKSYKQTKGKRFLLLPAFIKLIPKTRKGKLLDLGCGNGDLYPMVSKKGYDYFGLDISKDMIARAKKDYPRGNYSIYSASNFSKEYSDKFDIVLISMLFPAIGNKKELEKILKESVKVLKKSGRIIIGVTYPLFDYYMQFGLFRRKGIKTKFWGYFRSGSPFSIYKKIDGKDIIFRDYHWTLTDYVELINKTGLVISGINECKPIDIVKTQDKPFYEKRILFPTYLAIDCRLN